MNQRGTQGVVAERKGIEGLEGFYSSLSEILFHHRLFKLKMPPLFLTNAYLLYRRNRKESFKCLSPSFKNVLNDQDLVCTSSLRDNYGMPCPLWPKIWTLMEGKWGEPWRHFKNPGEHQRETKSMAALSWGWGSIPYMGRSSHNFSLFQVVLWRSNDLD